MENALMGDGLGRRRRRRKSKGLGKARRGARKGCSAAGIKANGRLRKGYRWAKGRASCAVPARRRRRK
jgi:hypothetical protein